jgi:hypothetical protein
MNNGNAVVKHQSLHLFLATSSNMHKGIVGLIDLLALSNHWLFGLIDVIGFGLIGLSAMSASVASSAWQLIGLVSLVGLSTHQPF